MTGIPNDYGTARRLEAQTEAAELVLIGGTFGGLEIRLTPRAAQAWEAMRGAAAAAGITLLAVSGFRSVERQTEIMKRKLAAGASIDEVLQTIAAPGYSEHHTGRALDIGAPGESPLTEGFSRTPEFRWLVAHAPSFGFKLSYPRGNPHGFVYEPWHWLFCEIP